MLVDHNNKNIKEIIITQKEEIRQKNIQEEHKGMHPSGEDRVQRGRLARIEPPP